MNNVELETFAEVQEATSALDKASLCPLTLIDTGVEKEVKNFRAVYNINKGQMVAAVGKNYHLIQNNEYFDTFCQALGNLGIKHKAIINQSKSMAVMDIIFDNKTIKFADLGEEFTTGIRVTNSYTRTKGLAICPRYTRLACTNGMVMSRFDITFSVDASQLQAALEQLSHKYKIKPLNESHEGLIDREVIITKDGVTKGAHAFILNWYGSGLEIMNKEESTDTNIHKIKVRFGLSKTDPVGWYKRHEFIFAGEDSKENLSDMQAKYDEKKRHFDKVRDEFNNFKFELKKKGYSITKDKISI